MTRALCAIGVLAAFALSPVPAVASSFTLSQTFCVAGSDPTGEHASCPSGLGATLSIASNDLTLDDNDYTVTYTLDSSSALFDTTSYVGVNQIDFKITGIQSGPGPGYGDYQVKPTVDTSQVDNGDPWTVYLDNVNNGSSNGCDADGSGGFVCAGSPDITDTGDIDIWTFAINLDSGFYITSTTDLNMRAVFVGPYVVDTKNPRKSGYSNGTIMSPEGNNIPDTGTGTGGPGGAEITGGTAVPEPASLMLLGSGLALAATRMRRRK